MCLIIASKEGKLPDADLMKRAYDDNPHGWGVMWADNGKITAIRGLKYESMVKALKRAEGKPYVLHTRWATHGSKTVKNCHPFQVAPGMWIAHNGVISIATPVEDRSDTWHWAQSFASVIKQFPWVMEESYRPKLIEYVEKWVGKRNKVAMLKANGDILIANESAGLHYNGMWLSNSNSLWEEEAYDYSYRHTYTPQKYQDAISAFSHDGDAIDLLSGEIAQCDYCPTFTSRLYRNYDCLLCRACYVQEIAWQARYMDRVESDGDESLTEEDIEMLAATAASLQKNNVVAINEPGYLTDDVPF